MIIWQNVTLNGWGKIHRFMGLTVGLITHEQPKKKHRKKHILQISHTEPTTNWVLTICVITW